MIIISPEAVKNMSMIIAAYNSEYCAFFADTRRAYRDDDGRLIIQDDNYHKIIPITNGLILGMAGFFRESELKSQPLSDLPDISTFQDVVSAIENYVERNKEMILMTGHRVYFLGGINEDGYIQKYSLRCDVSDGWSVVKDTKIFKRHNKEAVVQIAFPQSLDLSTPESRNELGNRIKKMFSNENLPECIAQTEQIIKDISLNDESINDNVDHLLIYKFF